MPPSEPSSSSSSSASPTVGRPWSTAIVAGTAPPSRTICSTSRAIATLCGYGIPWLMIVDSSATTGAPAASASATSGATLSIGCGAVRWVVVIGWSSSVGGWVGVRWAATSAAVRSARTVSAERAGEGGEHLAVAGGLDDVGAVEQGVHVAGGHRVTGAGDVGDLDLGGADEHGPRAEPASAAGVPDGRRSTAGCRGCRAAPTRARRRGRAARSAAARTPSTVSATGRPTSAASSSTFGVTVCTRTDPSSTGAAAVALATLTGSSTERTPASWAADEQPADDGRVEVGVDDEGVGAAEQARHDGEVGHGQLVGGAHVGHRDVQVAAVVEHGGVGAGGVRARRRRAGTRRRRRRCAATTVSPAGSSPTAATSTVGRPSRARFSAMLRPTPPAVHEAVPGLLVPSTGGARGAHLGVEHRAPDDHDTGRRRRVFARVGHRSRLEERGACCRRPARGPHPQPRAAGDRHALRRAGPRRCGADAGHAGVRPRWFRREMTAAAAPARTIPARTPAPTCRYSTASLSRNTMRVVGCSAAGCCGSVETSVE